MYSTSSISIYNEYQFINGRQEIVGKTAQQSIQVRIQNLDSKGERVGTLLDQIATVNGVLMHLQ